MEIVDAQIHYGPDGLAELLAVMDALGISRALLDEYWGFNAPGPGFRLGNGAQRLRTSGSEIAAAKYPDRFAYLQRLDIHDPEIAGLIRLLRDAPAARAIRVTPGLTAVELHDFATGKYADCFGMAVDAGLAIFVMVQGNVHLLEPYLAQFPAGRFVVDHCGMPLEPALRRPESSIKVNVDPGPNYEYFDQVLALARWPNVALKWAHAQGIFGDTHYPFPSLTGFLRRAIDAFGMERVIWASDATVIHDTSWGDILYAVKANPDLSLLEKEWLLGKAVRQWLNWD